MVYRSSPGSRGRGRHGRPGRGGAVPSIEDLRSYGSGVRFGIPECITPQCTTKRKDIRPQHGLFHGILVVLTVVKLVQAASQEPSIESLTCKVFAMDRALNP